MNKIIGILALGLLFSAATFAFEEHVDYSGDTSRSGMHACPVGTYMTGINVSKNNFSCAKIVDQTYFENDEFVDSNTAHNGMHSCPDGYAMTGFHKSKNLLLCAPQTMGGLANRIIDTSTARNRMHTCPVGMVMTGIHVSRNHLACQYKY